MIGRILKDVYQLGHLGRPRDVTRADATDVMGDRTDASRNVSLEPPGAADGETRHNSVASPSEASLSSGKADVATRRARRTTVYPNVNSTNKIEKPFSRSAAKRGSVMALGSIEHLQHYFTKAGLSASKL